MSRCVCGRAHGIAWGFYAALLLATVCVGFAIRSDREYRAVHQIRVAGDSLLADWYAKKCIPR